MTIKVLLNDFRRFLMNEGIVKVVCYCLVGMVAFVICDTILRNADWLLGDDCDFLANTAIGKYKSLQDDVRIHGARLFPLGHYDINLTLLIPYGSTATGHYGLVAFEFIASIIGLLFLFEKSDRKKLDYRNVYINSFYLLLLIFISSAFLRIFMDITYPERILFLTLPLFMLFYLKGQETQKVKYYVLALFFAVYATYCKEPIFGVFTIIALTNILFGYKNLTKKDKLFHYALLINALIFITLYYFVVYRNAVSFYKGSAFTMSLSSLVAIVFRGDTALIFIFILGIIRGFYVGFKKDRAHLYYDGLLFAGMGYTLTVLLLHLKTNYYYTPSILLSLPVFVYWSKQLYEKRKVYALLILAPVLLIVFANFNSIRYYRLFMLQNRSCSSLFINSINKDYQEGKVLYWCEIDSEKRVSEFDKICLKWDRGCVNRYLNYINKENAPVKDFFVTMEQITKLKENEVFSYSHYNDYDGQMPEDIKKMLMDSGFTQEIDRYGVAIYKYQP